MSYFRTLVPVCTLALAACAAPLVDPYEATGEQIESIIRARFTKTEHRIPMRDGATLFTAVYQPRDTSEAWPILLIRSPYTSGPYGEDRYPDSRWGPSPIFLHENYIFVKQDVRGRFLSEGEFVNMHSLSHLLTR